MKKLILLLLFISASAYSVIVIDVFKQNANALNIAIVPFVNDSNNLSSIVANNLKNSGKFNPTFISNANTKDKQFEAVIYADIQRSGAKYEVSVFLKDIWTDKLLFSQKIDANTLSRKLAHYISDEIYFSMLGERSAFNTQLAYVEINEYSANKYSLVITDSDGENKKILFNSPSPILSPTFAPHNALIAYTAFSKNRSQVYVQSLYSNEVYTLPNFNGIASSPAWHPSGNKLLITLSKDGNSDIYEYSLSSGALNRLTSHSAIDTEASYSPNGRAVIWTSNRSGTPQIWQKKSGSINRVPIPGNYNTSASYSPNGEYLALVHLDHGSFKTAIFNFKDRDLILLSQNKENESPHFAPNSTSVIYSNAGGGIRITAIDGSHSVTLKDDNKIIEPTWSNF